VPFLDSSIRELGCARSGPPGTKSFQYRVPIRMRRSCPLIESSIRGISIISRSGCSPRESSDRSSANRSGRTIDRASRPSSTHSSTWQTSAPPRRRSFSVTCWSPTCRSHSRGRVRRHSRCRATRCDASFPLLVMNTVTPCSIRCASSSNGSILRWSEPPEPSRNGA
jgi:hypothetical protein